MPPQLFAKASVTFLLFVVGSAAAGSAALTLFETGCTHGCHPWDPRFFPFLVITLGALGGIHAGLSKAPLGAFALRILVPTLVIFGLEQLRMQFISDVGLFAVLLPAAVPWIAGAVVLRLARAANRRAGRAA